MRAKFGMLEQTHCLCLHTKFRLDSFILLLSGGEEPQILLFFGLRHFVVSPYGGSLRKLNTGAQLNLPLSNGIKIVSVLQCFHGTIMRTNSDIQMHDRQTKNSVFLDAPVAGEI